jgi:hypothetical protein
MTVYALNTILDTPQCQNLRPKPSVSRPPEVPEIPVVNTIPIHSNTQDPFAMDNTDFDWDPRKRNEKPIKPEVKPVVSKDSIVKLMSSFSSEQKAVIAAELANYLISNGRQGMSGLDLMEFLQTMLTPIVKILQKQKEDKLKKEQIEEELLAIQNPFKTEPGSKAGGADREGNSSGIKTYGVTSTRVVGSALPILPSVAFNL